MTSEESNTLITDVLRGHWPGWEFTTAQIYGWAKRLKGYDFQRAKDCIANLAFRWNKPGKPPVGVIFTAMEKAIIPRDSETSGPVQLYVIIRPDGRPAGRPIASPRGVPGDLHAVKMEAEAFLQRVSRGREGYYIQYLIEGVISV